MKTCSDGTGCPLVAESNHRIANHMAMLASYVSMRRREFSRLPDEYEDCDVLRLFDGIGAQVIAVSELHQMLTTTDRFNSGDISAQLGRICDAFRKGPACGTSIVYSGGADCILPESHILPVSQIVSEVITNALKYGHKAGCAGSIHVGCLRESDNRIIISVSDDGDGISPDTTGMKRNGIGFEMVAALVHQVNGTTEYRSSDSGLSFSLSLPSAVQGNSVHQLFLSKYDRSST